MNYSKKIKLAFTVALLLTINAVSAQTITTPSLNSTSKKIAKWNRKGDRCYYGRDYGKAIYWYRKSATRGHAKAQYHLGQMYSKGEGISKDTELAIYWWRKACDNGSSDACSNLE